MLGVDLNFFLGYPAMLDSANLWRVDGTPVHPYDAFVGRGVKWVRVRVWTKVEGVGGRDYAAKIATLALKKGLQPYLNLMLQLDWVPPPSEWIAFSFDARTQAIQRYCRETVAYFRGLGVTSGIYEVGNELDHGLEGAGVFESDPQKREDFNYMAAQIWPQTARLVRACEDGVRESDKGAKFILHTYHGWRNPEYSIRFYETMNSQGAFLDFIGLSFYPSAVVVSLEQFRSNALTLSTRFGKPVIVAEYAYPSSAAIPGGPFSNWNQAVRGYPLDLEGQRRWLSDFLRITYATPAIVGTFYMAPELYEVDSYWGTAYWEPFALFSGDGNAKPALAEFKRFQSVNLPR